MQESLAPEHGRELLADALEELLDGGAVADEGGGHLETAGRDVANSSLDVVGDPLHEVRAVLVLHVQHLLVDLLHGHAAAEHGGHGEVASVAGVAGGHHVLGVEHLLSQLGDGEGPVLLGAAAGEWGKSGHEEVKAGEGDHVDGELAKIGVQLTRESQTGGDSAHGRRDEMVEVAVSWGGELEGAEADIVECLVVDAVGLIGVFYELVNGEGSIVGLYHGVGHLGGGHHAESVHDSVRVLLTDLGDEEGAHARAGPTAEGVSELEALEAIAALGLLSDHIQDGIHQFCTFCVVALSPVVTCSALACKNHKGSSKTRCGMAKSTRYSRRTCFNNHTCTNSQKEVCQFATHQKRSYLV